LAVLSLSVSSCKSASFCNFAFAIINELSSYQVES
jgi:hypothetical protein